MITCNFVCDYYMFLPSSIDRLCIMMRCEGSKARLLPIPSFVPHTHAQRERERGKNINGARKEEDHQPQAKPDTHCAHTRRAEKACTHASQGIHCAESTQTSSSPHGTTNETSNEKHISTSKHADASYGRRTHKETAGISFTPASSPRSTEINKTVNQRNEYSKKDAAPLSPPFAKTKG